MAFTDTQKASIRRYLGFSEAFHQINTRLESMMDSLDARSPAASSQVLDILSQLQAIDAKNQDVALTGIDFAKAEDVQWNLDSIRQRQAYGRSLIQRLAITFEVEPARDYYDEGATGGGLLAIG